MRLMSSLSLGEVRDARDLTEHRHIDVVQRAGVMNREVEVFAAECETAAEHDTKQQHHHPEARRVRGKRRVGEAGARQHGELLETTAPLEALGNLGVALAA